MNKFLKMCKRLNLIDEEGNLTRKGEIIHSIFALFFLSVVLITPLFLLGYNIGLKVFYGG